MTITITITDPQLLDKQTLTHTASYLLSLAGHQLVKAPQREMKVNKEQVCDKTPDTLESCDTGAQKELIDFPIRKDNFSVPKTSVHDVTFDEPEKDSEGKEWDPLLHSMSRKKNADGTWRLKRVTESIKKIEEPATIVNEQSSQDKTQETLADSVETQLPQNNTSTATTSESNDLFVLFTIKALEAINDGSLTQTDIIRVANKHGLKNVPAIATRPDLIPSIAEELGINVKGLISRPDFTPSIAEELSINVMRGIQ